MNRLKQLRKESGLTVKQLGKIFNISPSTISLWEREGENLERNRLKHLSGFFNVSVEYLVGTDDNPKDARKKSSLANCETTRYNLYPVPIVKPLWQGGAIVDGDIKGYVYMKQKNKNDHFAVRFEDESMVNAAICCGSILITRIQNEAADGDIIVALVNGEKTVRRYKKYGESVFLMPENQAFEPTPITKNTDFKVLGKVVEVHTSL